MMKCLIWMLNFKWHLLGRYLLASLSNIVDFSHNVQFVSYILCLYGKGGGGHGGGRPSTNEEEAGKKCPKKVRTKIFFILLICELR